MSEQARELLEKTASLEKAIRENRVLSGMLPICMKCKKIRNDEGSWVQIEHYISQHSEAEFSHGMCETCMAAFYPDYRKPV